jgi:hypothetical protein
MAATGIAQRRIALAHSFLEVSLQATQLADLDPDASEFLFQKRTDVRATVRPGETKGEQLSNLVQREPELLDPPDESQALEVLRPEETKPAGTARRGMEQLSPLVIPNGVDAQASPSRHAADLQALAHDHLVSANNLHSGADSRVKVFVNGTRPGPFRIG